MMEEQLTALLAGVASGKRYWVRAPQGTLPPYVVLSRISGVSDYHTQGESGYVVNRVQADCYGNTYTEALTTARAAEQAVSGRRVGVIQGIFLEGERDLPTEDAGTVNNLFAVSLDFMVHHTR